MESYRLFTAHDGDGASGVHPFLVVAPVTLNRARSCGRERDGHDVTRADVTQRLG